MLQSPAGGRSTSVLFSRQEDDLQGCGYGILLGPLSEAAAR
jgi:hypothetical protein